MNWQKVLTPPFIVAGSILLLALVALQSVLGALQLHTIKKAVPLREQLFLIPYEIGPYRNVKELEEPPLPKEVEAELGTDKYIGRTYWDSRRKKTDTGSMVRLFVSYYTGTPDTVPHVPERCMVAGGAKGLGIYYREMDLSSARYYHITEGDDDHRQLMARTEQGHKVRMPTNEVTVRAFDSLMFSADSPSTVMYFFAANGRYIADPKGVRILVFDLRDKYAYWCKIELVAGHLAAGAGFVGEGPEDDAVATAERFLTYALPEIMACLPDWVEVREERYPVQSSSSSRSGSP